MSDAEIEKIFEIFIKDYGKPYGSDSAAKASRFETFKVRQTFK